MLCWPSRPVRVILSLITVILKCTAGNHWITSGLPYKIVIIRCGGGSQNRLRQQLPVLTGTRLLIEGSGVARNFSALPTSPTFRHSGSSGKHADSAVQAASANRCVMAACCCSVQDAASAPLVQHLQRLSIPLGLQSLRRARPFTLNTKNLSSRTGLSHRPLAQGLGSYEKLAPQLIPLGKVRDTIHTFPGMALRQGPGA